ncbi:hypothetical protein ACFE04_020370 [Oxalis oulophora]
MEPSIYDLLKDQETLLGNNVDPYSYISPSAYDTAWLAIVPDSNTPIQPMFVECFNWILDNQKEQGFWGDVDKRGLPTIETLPATIACVIALNKWNEGRNKQDKGLSFLEANLEKLLTQHCESFSRWFVIVFPSMVALVSSVGLGFSFSDRSKLALMNLSYNRAQILQREEIFDENHYIPLASCLEALPPSSYDHADIIKNLNSDGSLYQSPSATAQAFMATGNADCLIYLQSVVQRCPQGVPQSFPIDEELLKLSIVDHIQKLGLAEHFKQDTGRILAEAYRNYKNKEYSSSESGQQEIRQHVENNPEYFSSVMLDVFKATELMFPEEIELDEARSFSRNSLEKVLSIGQCPSLTNVIEHEINIPWITQMGHLQSRMWIEEENNNFWMGKGSFHMLQSPHKDNLRQLAIKNFESRQSTYKHELEELKRWTRINRLSDLGFGRERTTYCYFAIASCDSVGASLRMMVSKLAILITVTDDFYDTEGSILELRALTDAIRRWDGIGLSGHNKTIFKALDNFMTLVAAKHQQQHGMDISYYHRAVVSACNCYYFIPRSPPSPLN